MILKVGYFYLNVPRGTSVLGMGIPKSAYSLARAYLNQNLERYISSIHVIPSPRLQKAKHAGARYLENAPNHPDRTRFNSLRIASTRAFVGWDAPGILDQASVGK